MESIPSIENFKSRRKWEGVVWKKIVGGLADMESERGIEQILDRLMTFYEKQQIIKRASAISLLRQGKTYREIGELLWLSPQTISAIKKSTQTQTNHISYRTRNKKPVREGKLFLTKKEWRRQHLKEWLDLIFSLPPPPLALYRDPLYEKKLGLRK